MIAAELACPVCSRSSAFHSVSMNHLFRAKPLDRFAHEPDEIGRQLKRTLGPVQLTSLGVGAIIGAGIFSTVGTAAAGGADHLGAGPALVLSLLLTAITCGFAALCYAEFASMVPVSGSAYTYAYATLGELVAWIIGWDLIVEYAVGNVAVAISWSGYSQELLRGFGLQLPSWLGVDYRTAVQSAHQHAHAQTTGDPNVLVAVGDAVQRNAQALHDAPHLFGTAIVFNLPALLIVVLVTWVLVRGITESARLNSVMVGLKLAIVGLFLAVGTFYVKPENWRPFAPHGFTGISSAAAIIFFAYVGFDAVSTAAEETRNPQRDMPIGIIASLIICSLIYIAVALVLTGMLPYQRLNTAEPLATAFSALGMHWTAALISLGAVFATTSVLIVFQMGQTRIFYSMARDGLLPPWAARVHSRYRTPHVTTILTGAFVAAFAAVANIDEIVQLTNIGTLFAFVLVSLGIIVMRRTNPNQPRSFKTPFVPWVPLLSISSCGYLMFQLPTETWIRFIVWLAVGLVVYFAYGIRHSAMRTKVANATNLGVMSED
jgi:basic amino acid/polyamine antiporter, APA family